MGLGLGGEKITDAVRGIKTRTDQILEPTRTYDATITPSKGHRINLNHLQSYIEDSLDHIDEQEYTIDLSFTPNGPRMDPNEARNLYANEVPDDKAKITLETPDQEIIDEAVSNLEVPESRYDFNSQID